MPRARLGQHFLHDQNIVRKIIREAALSPSDRVVEIGAGRGILTRALAAEAGEVVALEIDQGLFDELQKRPGGPSNITVVHADAMDYPFETIPPPFKIVANLPYHIASRLIIRLLGLKLEIPDMVLMVQMEAAERLISPPGGKNYGLLSVLTQYYAHPRLAFKVSRRCFQPPPKVDSAVIHLTMRPEPLVAVRNEPFFFSVVRGGFAHRRKILRNSLLQSGFSDQALDAAARLLPLDMNRRAETLTLEEFARLSDILFELTPRL